MGIEDIRNVKSKIEELNEQKFEKMDEHRKTVGELKNLGVSDKMLDSTKRSKTFSEVLGPMEDEIKEIAVEISSLREENDLQPSRLEILKQRQSRLDGLWNELSGRFLTLVDERAKLGGEFWVTEEGKLMQSEMQRINKLKDEIKNELKVHSKKFWEKKKD